MTPNEQDRMVAGISATAESMGAPLSEGALVLMAADLAAFPLADVVEALQRTRREHHGRLTIAAVFERLPGASRTMTADEAWSLVLQKEPWNEERTCVLPQAALTAWYAGADVYRVGDQIGARMAFKGAWPAAVAEHGAAVAVSEGWDREDRTRAIEQAVAEGLIGPDKARAHGVLIEGTGDAEPARIERPESADTVPVEQTRNLISQFADNLRGQAAARKTAEENANLAEAMVRHGRAPDFDTGLHRVETMPGAERAALTVSMQEAELAEMAPLADSAFRKDLPPNPFLDVPDEAA